MLGLIISIVGVITFTLGIGVGMILNHNQHKTKSRYIRKGIIHKKWAQKHLTGGMYNVETGGTIYSGEALCVVGELEKVRNYSKVEVLTVENCPWELVDVIKEEIGEYVNTSDIKWDSDNINENEEIIKTPMNELVKHIEMENIKDM